MRISGIGVSIPSIRADYSVLQAYRFDTTTGAPLHGDNHCGHGVDSHWSRGSAWAIYGFALGYRHTGDERYLSASLRLSRKFISLLDAGVIPLWDFLAPPHCRPHMHDTSAAAIVACGFQELAELGHADGIIIRWKDAFLDRLCSADHFDIDPAIRGSLKNASAGPSDAAYTSWGDDYLMEALARENGMAVNWW